MKSILYFLSVWVAATATNAAEPVTFNTHAFSTNDPVDSAAAEAAFLQAVSSAGFTVFCEDFESAVWGPTRSPGASAPVVSHGINWQSSTGNLLRTVGDSDSYDVPPPYMVYAHDPVSGFHPAPNTVIGESAARLYGIGFWADGTGTKGKIKVIFDDTVEVKFQRITGYDHNPPDPPEPVKETVRLTYSKEFFGVYVPGGFHTFQLLEFAGEFDEVVLMWMRTFSFGYLPPLPTPDITITGVEAGPSNLQVRFTSTPAHSNFVLQANHSLLEPLEWNPVHGPVSAVTQDQYMISTGRPAETGQVFRILGTP